ncbi:MAG: cell surface protein, partial [Pseudomonadota bacterium]
AGSGFDLAPGETLTVTYQARVDESVAPGDVFDNIVDATWTSKPGDDAAERAGLELDRDEALRALQKEEKRYQVAKDLADNITVGYNTSEVIMTRLVQTTNAKERVYAQAVSFFGTNETVLTALTATFTGMHGLHESTQTLEAMKKGINESLETLSEIGGKVQEAAVEAGYGPTVAAASVKMLVESVINYQERSQQIIAEMRKMSTENSEEIRTAVEDGKRRLAHLIETGAAAALEQG